MILGLDMAALCFSGPALKWFESLDDESQRDWRLLRQAMLRQYAEPSYQVAIKGTCLTNFIFRSRLAHDLAYPPPSKIRFGRQTSPYSYLARRRPSFRARFSSFGRRMDDARKTKKRWYDILDALDGGLVLCRSWRTHPSKRHSNWVGKWEQSL